MRDTDQNLNRRALEHARTMPCMFCGSKQRDAGDYRGSVERENRMTKDYIIVPVCMCAKCRNGAPDSEVEQFIGEFVASLKMPRTRGNTDSRN